MYLRIAPFPTHKLLFLLFIFDLTNEKQLTMAIKKQVQDLIVASILVITTVEGKRFI